MVKKPPPATRPRLDPVAPKRRLAVEERRNNAFRMWMTGINQDEIARRVHVSRRTVARYIEDSLEAMRPHAEYDRYRAEQLAELHFSRRILRRTIMLYDTSQGESLTDTLKVIETLLRLQEREAKLLGLDRVPTPYDELAAMPDERLEEIVREWALAEREEANQPIGIGAGAGYDVIDAEVIEDEVLDFTEL